MKYVNVNSRPLLNMASILVILLNNSYCMKSMLLKCFPKFADERVDKGSGWVRVDRSGFAMSGCKICINFILVRLYEIMNRLP